jgi:hypothetical protein
MIPKSTLTTKKEGWDDAQAKLAAEQKKALGKTKLVATYVHDPMSMGKKRVWAEVPVVEEKPVVVVEKEQEKIGEPKPE